MRRAIAWLDERTGLPKAVSGWLGERVPGGARWAYVFGSALVALLLAEFATGFALALSYSPSVTSAWASVARLELSPFGRLFRALHHHGATLVVVVVALHVLQTALAGAFRKPREVTWWLGLVLLGCVLGFALTGSLLPWDERGYWATRVTAGISATVPLAGGALQRAVLGGPELGNLSLTRFYAFHVVLLPLLTVLASAAHVLAVRRHGITPVAVDRPDEPFWPRQALYDAAFSLVLLAGLLAFALAKGAPLGAPADPSAAGVPRPEWYFRPLFGLLTLMPARLEVLATVFIPLAAAAFLIALPLLDRGARRSRPLLLVLLGGCAATVLLGVGSWFADARNPAYGRGQAAAERRAQAALQMARAGVPPEGGLAMLQDQPEERGRKLFAQRCSECHVLAGKGEPKAPRMDGFLSKAWIVSVVSDPNAPDHFGNTKVRGMDGYAHLGPEKLSLLGDFLVSLRDAKGGPETFSPAFDAGRRVFEQANCADCHALKPGETSLGPSLARYGSSEWLADFVRDPGTPRFYGKENDMPAFAGKLTAQQIDDVVAFLRTLSGEGAVAATPR